MKILWVEDFGGDLKPSKVVIGMFGSLIEEDVFDSPEYDTDKDVSEQLPALFEKYTLHQIFICKSYPEWKRVNEEQNGDFDIALIDINLTTHRTPADEIPEGFDKTGFDKKAGFHIYHQLIKNGFPDDDIAFFTGEKNTMKDFSGFCKKIMVEKPRNVFEKSEADFGRLRGWLDKKAAQESLILRRGILEGCGFLKRILNTTEESGLESRLIFFKTTSRDINQDGEVFKNEVLDYLTQLESFFIKHPRYDRGHTLYFFVRAVAMKWHMSLGNFRRAKASPVFETKLEDLFYRTGQFQMKMLRNWCAHEAFTSEVSERDAAYFFMVAMRCWISFDLKVALRYESILSGLFPKRSEGELNAKINSVLERHLEQSYFELKAFHSDISRYLDEPLPGNGMGSDFLSLLRDVNEVVKRLERIEGNDVELVKRRIRKISMSLFYQSYWHGLFPSWVKSTYYADMQSLGFNIEPIPPGSFIHFLGSLIFKESFKEQELSVTVR